MTHRMTIRRQLCIGAIYAREAKEDDLRLILIYLSSLECKCNEIIEILIDIWRDNSSSSLTASLPSSTSSSSSSPSSSSASPAEVLRIALNIPFLSSKASIACLECIHEGIISGRSAIFCISEIRISLLSIASTNISCTDNDDSIKQKATYIYEVANLIIQPFLSNNNIVSDLQSITCCLDLVPVAVNALFNLRKQYPFLSKMDIQVINSFFDSEMPLSASILNILTEIYPRLRGKHLVNIKKQVIALVPSLQRQCDEFPGVMRICLRFFEQSNDSQWIHIFRVLYASVPLGEMQNVEALLEQVLSQSAHMDQALIDILEDTATHFCKYITNRTASHKSGEEEIPMICLADVRLLLMTMRITNTSNLHLNLMLPSIVAGNVEESSTVVRNSRALIMILMSISLLSNYNAEVFKQLYNDSTFNMNTTCDAVTLTKYLCRTIHCCLVDESGRISNWLSSVRGMEIISACIYAVFYPSVTQACMNFVHQCMMSRFRNDMIDSRNDTFEHDEMATSNFQLDEVITEINISELISESLITVFQDISDCRSSLLSLIMKGLVACFQSSKMFKVNFVVAEEAFIKLFRDICYLHPRMLVQSHASLENYILTASVLPVLTLERIMSPLSTGINTLIIILYDFIISSL